MEKFEIDKKICIIRVIYEIMDKLSWKLILENIDYIIIELELNETVLRSKLNTIWNKDLEAKMEQLRLVSATIISNNGL